jgi:hypothetical protein
LVVLTPEAIESHGITPRPAVGRDDRAAVDHELHPMPGEAQALGQRFGLIRPRAYWHGPAALLLGRPRCISRGWR